ncbi:MAG: GNAT family N-acetyltransferase [Thermodesulfobacteriota bacterium]
MIIRPYTPDDGRTIGLMLVTEGLEPEEMEFVTGNTFVAEDYDGSVVGFYTYKLEGVFPHLQHYCVDKDARDGTLDIARALIREFRRRMKSLGYAKAIINSPKCKRKIGRLIQWYFKAEPYGTDDAHKFFLVNI